jgi:hypothetical protein
MLEIRDKINTYCMLFGIGRSFNADVFVFFIESLNKSQGRNM